IVGNSTLLRRKTTSNAANGCTEWQIKSAKRRKEMRNSYTDEFGQMPLRVHSFLAGVPLHSLSRVALPGGREGMTLPEIKAVIGFDSGSGVEVGPMTKALFWLRMWIGRILGWDDAQELAES